MATPGIPNNYTLSTTCFGTRLGNIQDQIFAAVGMGFRRLELGLAEAPPSMEGLDESRRETGVVIPSLVAGCRDSSNGGLVADHLGSLQSEECERALNSIRRHVRLARSWGCATVVIRGSKMEDEALRREAREYEGRVVREGATPELKEDLLEFAQRAQRACQPQIEQLCRSLFTLRQETPETRFAVESGRALDDLIGLDAMGWILDDLSDPRISYWHDVGCVHQRERLGLPGQGEWLEAYGARVSGVHLQDAAEEEEEMPLGLGEVDFQLLKEYLPMDAEWVLEISPRHGRAEILASVQFLADHGF